MRYAEMIMENWYLLVAAVVVAALAAAAAARFLEMPSAGGDRGRKGVGQRHRAAEAAAGV